MAVTKAKYASDMQGMLFSAGWREHFYPRMQYLRNGILEDMAYNAEKLEEMLGLRYALRFVDQILETPAAVKTLQAELAASPAEELDMVESQSTQTSEGALNAPAPGNP